MAVAPHRLFGVFTPSEIAECCVDDQAENALYEKLWSLLPEYADFPRENRAQVAMVNWWSRFTEAEQAALNAAVTAFEARYRALAQA